MKFGKGDIANQLPAYDAFSTKLLVDLSVRFSLV